MLSDTAIRDRFILCLGEVRKDYTLTRIATILQTHQNYLSSLSTHPRPKVPAILIARFCDVFGFSPYYIILGKGGPKETGQQTIEEKLLEINANLIDALLEVKVKVNDPVRQLLNEAKKREQ
jgi:hypothetical protein